MRKFFLGILAVGTLTFVSCNNDDDDNVPTTSNLTLNITGLEALGDDYVYEGWIIVDGNPVTTGRFSSVDFPQTFTVNKEMLDSASKFVLSIEPTQDSDPAPSDTKILAGDFSGNSASINSAIVGDFSNATGKYILATPTDGDGNNERSGVWFLNIGDNGPEAGLDLPELPEGWKYEGWVVFDGTPVTTGTFTNVAAADDNAATSMFKGDMGNGPAFPGEDFIQNAPEGLTFPTDLRGKTVVISVEPSPDNSPAPFTFKPLASQVADDAEDHSPVTMGEGPAVSLSGSVTR